MYIYIHATRNFLSSYGAISNHARSADKKRYAQMLPKKKKKKRISFVWCKRHFPIRDRRWKIENSRGQYIEAQRASVCRWEIDGRCSNGALFSNVTRRKKVTFPWVEHRQRTASPVKFSRRAHHERESMNNLINKTCVSRSVHASADKNCHSPASSDIKNLILIFLKTCIVSVKIFLCLLYII